MKARFPQASQQAPQQASQQAPPQEISQIACQAPEYHHCKLCNASFSSMARLIKHAQENICDKPSYRHCDMVFSSKNRLHRHLREECQKQMHRQPRSSSKSSSLSSPPCPPTYSPSPPPEENRASISPSPLPPSPPPQYHVLSPPPPTYRNCLTVADLYARYTPQYLKMDDLFRIFGRRSARSSTSAAPTTPAASKHPPIRHRGRCQAKKGDRSSQAAKHQKPSKTPKTTKTKQQN